MVHVLSLKGLFLYLSPSSRKVLEYEPSELVGTPLSSVCHPSDIVPVTRELKDTSAGSAVNVVFRIRRKHNGYTWFESHGSLHLEQGKGRKCIIMVGRERPVYALARSDINNAGSIGESELWTKMSTSGMFLFVSSNVRSLLDRQPEDLVGTSAQALMRKESRIEFGKMLEHARTGKSVTFKHDVQNKRGQTLQARTTLYSGDACEGQKPTFFVAQTRLLKLARHANRPTATVSPQADQKAASPATSSSSLSANARTPQSAKSNPIQEAVTTLAGGHGLPIGNQHEALASEDNVFDELKTTRSTSWQFELRQMEKRNRLLAEELQGLLSSKKKRKRSNGAGRLQKDCANCHTRVTPEWRRGPSGNRDLCNSCGLRWAKEVSIWTTDFPRVCKLNDTRRTVEYHLEHLRAIVVTTSTRLPLPMPQHSGVVTSDRYRKRYLPWNNNDRDKMQTQTRTRRRQHAWKHPPLMVLAVGSHQRLKKASKYNMKSSFAQGIQEPALRRMLNENLLSSPKLS